MSTRVTYSRYTTTASMAIVLMLLAGCAVNPATGKRQLSLVSERDEAEMGKLANQQYTEELGRYDDDPLQEYVGDVGRTLAANSERPELPWTFTVIDDTTVNAFALPGGYIFLTRGILAHFNSEAEMASVLGHEIGHVTARHSVNQISKQQLAGLGLGIGRAVTPEDLGGLVDLAEAGMGLMFLKFGRDDERESDDLGMRYMMWAGYDPRESVDVFETLARVSQQSGARIPNWQSTHPAPENRRERTEAAISQLDRSLDDMIVGRDGYLDRIDGIVFGIDPREGYFKDHRFFHPGLAFGFDFPAEWRTVNQKRVVGAISPEKDALVQITGSGETDPEGALAAFFEQDGLTAGRNWVSSIGGLPAASRSFAATTQSGTLKGMVAFVGHRDRVYQLMALTPETRWEAYDDVLLSSLKSFAEVDDPAVLAVQPARVEIVTLGRTSTIAEVGERFGSTASAETLALINGMSTADRLDPGRRVKIVKGGELP